MQVPHCYAECVNAQIENALAPSQSECALVEERGISDEKKLRAAAEKTRAYQFRKEALRARIDPLIAQLNSGTQGRRTASTVETAGQTAPRIRFSKRFEGDVMTFLSICDQVLAHLPEDEDKGLSRRFLARQQFGQSFRVKEAEVIYAKFARLLRLDLPSISKRPKMSVSPRKLHPNGRLLGGFDEFLNIIKNGQWDALENESFGENSEASVLEKLHALLLKTSDTSIYGSELENNDDDHEQRDIVKTMMSELGISRFATLNYDVQAERQILRDQRMVEYDEAVDFRDLCDEKKTPRPHRKRLLIESGVEKGAMSASLDQTNIAEIVNFSAYAKRFSRQVMHLHGRYDDPDNIILTPEDYRTLYAERSISRDSFSNAQQTLFDGNDVLFVGIGASEDDVNRPLKRFLASEQSSHHATRRAFLLFPSEACGKCFTAYSDGKSCRDCRAKNEALVLDKYTQLGVHVQIYGGAKFRALRGSLSDMIEKLSPLDVDWDTVPKDEKPNAAKLLGVLRKLHETCEQDVWRDISSIEKDDGSGVTLLTAGERDFLNNSLTTLIKDTEEVHLGPHVAALVRGIIEELRGRVMARAACAELKSMKERSQKWWEAWNEQPFERRALYRMVDCSIAGERNYLWARHCPDVNFATRCTPKKWSVLKRARERAAKQVARQTKRNMRIARFAINRGGGQGSLVRLMLQKPVHEYLMGGCAGGESTYSAAFVAHLSFSMEFSSVARALTRFVARRVAEVQVELGGTEVRRGIARIIRQDIRAFDRDTTSPVDKTIALKRLLKEIAPKEKDTCADVIDAFCARPAGSARALSFEECKTLAEALFISRRETEPRLVEDATCRDYRKLRPTVERLHRLDVLERVLRLYQHYADLVNTKREKLDADAKPERVMICLGGLDRLCDSDGDAHNPMHRAFFRLLTGTHEHVHHDAPIDFVFLSGKRSTPICFLSEVLDPEDVATLPSQNYKKYARHSKTKQVLRKWDRLARFSWDERLRLVPEFCGKRGFENFLSGDKRQNVRARQAAKVYHDWLNDRDASTYSLTSDTDKAAKGLHRGLWENVGLSSMLFACWRTHFEKEWTTARSELTTWDEPKKKAWERAKIKEFMAPFEGRFDKDDANGIIGVLFSKYERLDNTSSTAKDNDHVLFQLILRHLALFSIPIEPWVLMGCPRLYNALLAEFDKRLTCEGGATPDEQDWAERAWMLDRLRDALQTLHMRGMVIRILPSGLGETETQTHEVFLHQRFSIHGRVREYIAYKMEMNIFDQGDINHHQISLYCDQPRDLPTPTTLHFEMIANILNFQRTKNRETLGLVYRHAGSERQRGFGAVDPDIEQPDRQKEHVEREAQEAATRLFIPKNMDAVLGTLENVDSKAWKASGDQRDAKRAEMIALGGSLGRIHSVSQRIRGSFSLIRTAFSVGSLSRMDAPMTPSDDMPPFEQYGSWLRGIMNAAIGVRVNTMQLSGVLDGTLLPKGIEELSDGEGLEGALDFETAEAVFEGLGVSADASATLDELKHYSSDARNIALAAERRTLNDRQATAFKRVRHPLYRDEIAWLYNERGLASLTQGRLFDALPLFRKARDIMSHRVTPASDTKAFNAVERRINLNYAIAKIERGKIRDARLILEDLKRSSVAVKFSTPSRLAPYIEGYLALCDHLGGSFETARDGYMFSVKALSDTQDLRAVAIFKRHLSDLYRSIGDLDSAMREIELAINAASKAQQRDILNLAKSSKAQILLAHGRRVAARDSLPEILDYASRMGLYSHRADALLVEARVRVDVGDLGPAAHAASGAIALCTRHGLRLRKLSSLIIYGNIQHMRGLPPIGRSILENARAEAETIGYQLKAAEASNLLARESDPLLAQVGARDQGALRQRSLL